MSLSRSDFQFGWNSLCFREQDDGWPSICDPGNDPQQLAQLMYNGAGSATDAEDVISVPVPRVEKRGMPFRA